MNIHATIILSLCLFPQFDHAGCCVAIRMCVEVESVIRLIDGDIQVRQVELNRRLWIP